jgi:SAC3/GANP family
MSNKGLFEQRHIQLAIELRTLIDVNHYAKLFNLLRDPSTPYLFACCIHLHFKNIRKRALKAMMKAYYLIDGNEDGAYLVNDLIRILGLDGEEEAESLLNHFEIKIDIVNGEKRALIGQIAAGKRVTQGTFIGLST